MVAVWEEVEEEQGHEESGPANQLAEEAHLYAQVCPRTTTSQKCDAVPRRARI